MAKMLDYDIIVNEFELQSRYYVHFRTYTLGKGMNSFNPLCYELNGTTIVLLQGWLWHWITHQYTIKETKFNWSKPQNRCASEIHIKARQNLNIKILWTWFGIWFRCKNHIGTFHYSNETLSIAKHVDLIFHISFLHPCAMEHLTILFIKSLNRFIFI